MATLTPVIRLQFFDSNGDPLVGGKLYTYAAGTTTPLATYTSAAGDTTNTNPIILNSRGEANVWISAAQYKFVLKTSTEVEIWTVDNIGGFALATSPSIVGNAVFTDDSGTAAVRITQTGPGPALLVEDSVNVDTTPFIVDSSGAVGVGTLSPGQKLDVVGNIRASGIVYADTVSEYTLDTGVTVGGVLLKNGFVDPASVYIVNKGAIVASGQSALTYTGIPAWVRRITLAFENISLTGTDDFIIRIGTAAGFVTTGYAATNITVADPNIVSSLFSTTGYRIFGNNAAVALTGVLTLTWVAGPSYVLSGTVAAGTNTARIMGGVVTLPSELTQLTVIPSGTNTFDGGTITLYYE
jgi:hypothetical protein